ncbi:MAG: flavoprotein [Patescibacteria group bacterium]
MLKNKKILLGITGCIGAYRMCSLINRLKASGATVKVIMSAAATQLISLVTIQTLSNSQVYLDTFETHDKTVVEHIHLADWCDIFVLAPATANTISKLSCGIADNLLTTVMCALPKKTPVLIAPAMNCHMWENEIIQSNISKLRNIKIGNLDKYSIVGPIKGKLACGYEGEGALIGNDVLQNNIEKLLKQWKK